MLNYEYPPLGGGAGNATFYILKEFSSYDNIHNDLVTSSLSGFKIINEYKNINIHYLDISKKGSLHSQSFKDLLIYSKKALKYSKELIKKKKYNLVHAILGIPCGYIAMKLKLPYIVSLRGSDVPFHTPKYFYLDKLIFKSLSRKIWGKAKYVIANSKGLKEEANNSAPEQKIDVIYNGIDTKLFKPPKSKFQDNTLNIVSTGRLAEHKGFNYLIEALSRIEGVKLTLIGDGKQLVSLKESANKLEVNVIFKGRLKQTEIVTELQKSDIFVLPSLTEGMSNAILEAMACGLPIIATNVGGSIELIKSNGFIVEKCNSKSIKEKVFEYLNNKGLIEIHGENSLEISKSMTWQKVSEEYIKLYSSLLSK